MEKDQFNVPMPVFSIREFAELRVALRELGTKPTKGDLVAALIHQALGGIENAKAAVEAFVVYELDQERKSGTDEL
jgi:hypothetical protein